MLTPSRQPEPLLPDLPLRSGIASAFTRSDTVGGSSSKVRIPARLPLQALRGTAALLVMLYHLGGVAALDKYFALPWLDVPFSYGDFGVEIFFVLSGFLIALAHRHDWGRPERLGSFVFKRFARIFPMYWLIFAAVYGAVLLIPALNAGNTHDGATILRSLLLLPQDRNAVGGTGAPIIIVAWSLQYEMSFYAVFALIICHRLCAPAAALLLLLVNVWVLAEPRWATVFPLSFLTSDYVPLFVLGMLAWKLTSVPDRAKARHGSIAFTVGIAVLAATEICKMQLADHTLPGKVLLCGIGAALLVYGLVSNERIMPAVFGNSLLRTVGDASYILFLIHFPVISLLAKIAMAAHLDRLHAPGAVLFCIVTATTCVVLAIVIHQLIEKPITKWIRSLAPTLSARSPESGAVA